MSKAYLFTHPTAGKLILAAGLASTRFLTATVSYPPSVILAISNQVFTTGTGDRTINLLNHFAGTALVFSLQSPVTGVSITGNTLTIDDASVLASATVTVEANNAYGSTVTISFTREVVSSGSFSLNEFSRDEVVFGSGAAVGNDYASIPLSGTGPAGDSIQARAYSLDDSGVTSSAWQTIATVDAFGNWSGNLTALKNRSWYQAQTRLVSNNAITANMAYKFGVGHIIAIWGQSEQARSWDTGFNLVSTPALFTIKDQVKNLKEKGMCGRTSTATLNVAAPGNLPASSSLSGRIITISGTQTLKDWYFEDYRVDVANGANITFDQCYWKEVNVANTQNFMLYMRLGGRGVVKNSTFEGANTWSSNFAAAIKEESSGTSSYGKVDVWRCKFTYLASDSIKNVAGSVRWCYFYYENNTGATGPILNWSAATTYQINDYALNGNGNVYKAIAVNTNKALPTNKAVTWNSNTNYSAGQGALYNGELFLSAQGGNSGNTPVSGTSTAWWTLHDYWRNLDPHVDIITSEKSLEKMYIEYNYMDMTKGIPTYGGTGMNNYIRPAPNSGTFTAIGLDFRFNYCDRWVNENSYSFQVTSGFDGPVKFYGCWVEKGGTSNYIYPVGAGQSIEWTGMKTTSDATVSPPTNTTGGTFTNETNDNKIQHIYNNRSPVNAGTTIMRKMTEASRYTPSFAFLANISLAEDLGVPTAYLHHTVSGTGFGDLFNSNMTDARSWNDDLAIHNMACADGAHVDVFTSSWYAGPQGSGLYYGDIIYELSAKKNVTTGTALSSGAVVPTTNPGVSGGATASTFWADIYNYTKTRYVVSWHMRQGTVDHVNSFRHASGIEFMCKNYYRCGYSASAIVAAKTADNVFTSWGGDVINYEVGTLSGNMDNVHPAGDTLDGLAQHLGLIVHNARRAAGISKWAQPQLDNVYWDPSGNYVEVWSSAGDITTTRKDRGLTALNPATFSHWTEVINFEYSSTSPDLVNGTNLTPVTDAIIVASDGSGTPATAGRIRITKPGGGTFVSGDNIMFGNGSAYGGLAYPEDIQNRLWMNTPIVKVGAFGYNGANTDNQLGISPLARVTFTRP